MLSMKSTHHILIKLSFHFSSSYIRFVRAETFIFAFLHRNISSAIEQRLAHGTECLSINVSQIKESFTKILVN